MPNDYHEHYRFPFLLFGQILLIVMKLTDVLDLPWWLILAPIWFPVILPIIATLVILGMFAYHRNRLMSADQDDKKNKENAHLP